MHARGRDCCVMSSLPCIRPRLIRDPGGGRRLLQGGSRFVLRQLEIPVLGIVTHPVNRTFVGFGDII